MAIITPVLKFLQGCGQRIATTSKKTGAEDFLPAPIFPVYQSHQTKFL
jgi:hypothetical protein